MIGMRSMTQEILSIKEEGKRTELRDSRKKKTEEKWPYNVIHVHFKIILIDINY